MDSGENQRVRRIVEKPPGGCPIGSMANIMVHRVCGSRVIERLSGAPDYEAAVNELIEAGVPAHAAPIDFWLALKTPEDLVEAAMRGLEVS